MGFLDRFTKQDSLKEGLAGIAVLRSKPKWGPSNSDVEPRSFRSWPLELDLEVRVEGRAPYAVLQKFKVPKRWYDISTGLEVPVRVDSDTPDRILIDWDAFAAAGGKQLVEERLAHNQREANKKATQRPEFRQAEQAVVEDLLGEVQAGRRSIEEFTGVVDDYVAGGNISTEEGEAYKARAAG
ncbi:MAG TPA: hypothetical protein VMQ81_10250 [Acidimicrobiia bacterium]|nr:hypothetical protein [Acidimicrobiia bacterium]